MLLLFNTNNTNNTGLSNNNKLTLRPDSNNNLFQSLSPQSNIHYSYSTNSVLPRRIRGSGTCMHFNFELCGSGPSFGPLAHVHDRRSRVTASVWLEVSTRISLRRSSCGEGKETEGNFSGQTGDSPDVLPRTAVNLLNNVNNNSSCQHLTMLASFFNTNSTLRVNLNVAVH